MKKERVEEEAVLLLNRGKRGLLRVVLGRTLVILALLVVQFMLLLAAFVRIGEYYFGSAVVASLLAGLVVINKKGEATGKITWLLLIFLMPVLGIPLYFYVEADLGSRMLRRRLQTLRAEGDRYRPDTAATRRTLAETEPAVAGLAAYVERMGGGDLYDGSDARYLPTGEAAFEEMLRHLERAEKFIFLETFIIDEGYMWGRILNILERKAREGVEIRVLYDGTCVIRLPYRYPEQLQKLGIQCRMFSPPRPLVSTHYNNRDHRKILVVDGRCAIAGGVNLADEYINRTSPFGHWKDTAVCITGRAVAGFTLLFLQMWSVTGWEREGFFHYLNASAPVEGGGYILPYGDQPMDDERLGEMVYAQILNRASRYVHIMTPYLILDQDMVTALTFAAKRGVEVKVILPGIPDKKMVFALSRSYYKELLAAGVEIWEYTPGFVHGKMFVSDDDTAVVGSINLDYRSLHLHFECAALLHGCTAVAEVERDMQATLARCRRITPEVYRRRSVWQKLLGWLFRPLAPLV